MSVYWNKTKRKRRTIEVLYEIGKPTLRVQKVIGKHLETTGIPVPGGFELHPEEAVYLLETGSATISTSSGADVGLLEAYTFLEVFNVPRYKYEIYKQVKQMGLVVFRPRKQTIHLESLKRIENAKKEEFVNRKFEMVMKLNNIPAEGVMNPGSFPSYAQQNGNWIVHMISLHNDPALVNFLPPMNDFSTTKVLKDILPPTASVQRRKPCRPVQWPSSRINNYLNWQEFNLQTETFHHDLQLKRFRKIRTMSQNELRSSKVSVEDVDFHVFSPCNFSHRLPARPLFSIICLSASSPPLKIPKISQLSNVVIAVEESAKITFLSLSGESINLREFLKP